MKIPLNNQFGLRPPVLHCDKRNLTALLDEAPGAYRDIREVMQAQHDLTRQEKRLTPLLNFKYPDNRK